MRRWIVALGVSLGLLFALAPALGELFIGLAIAVAVTAVFELSVAALMRMRDTKGFLAIALLNVVTAPGFHYASWKYAGDRYYAALILAMQLTIVLIEWGVLLRVLDRRPWTAGRTLFLVVAMNLASLIGGYVVLIVVANLI